MNRSTNNRSEGLLCGVIIPVARQNLHEHADLLHSSECVCAWLLWHHVHIHSRRHTLTRPLWPSLSSGCWVSSPQWYLVSPNCLNEATPVFLHDTHAHTHTPALLSTLPSVPKPQSYPNIFLQALPWWACVSVCLSVCMCVCVLFQG